VIRAETKGRNETFDCTKFFVLLGVIVPTTTVLAAQQAGPLPITRIRTGWNADSFAIETNQAVATNPANCPSSDAYLSDSSQPGYKTYYAATLTAFSLGKPIVVIVSDTECVAGRPEILGIYLSP